MIFLVRISFDVFFTVSVSFTFSKSAKSSVDRFMRFCLRWEDRVIFFVSANKFKESTDCIFRRNSHIDIRYDESQTFDSLSLKNYTISILEFDLKTWQNALWWIKDLRKAFAAYFALYRIDFVLYCFLFDDIKIIDKTSKIEIFVELKNYHCQLKVDDDDSSMILEYNQQTQNFIYRTIFNFKTQWDYIFSVIRIAAKRERT